MKAIIDNNVVKASLLQVSADGILPDVAVLRSIRISYATDAEGKKTNKVDAVRYNCINPTDFSSFTIKVVEGKPLMTNEELEESEEPVYIAIPIDKVIIRPYEITYGVAKVTILSPYVSLAE